MNNSSEAIFCLHFLETPNRYERERESPLKISDISLLLAKMLRIQNLCLSFLPTIKVACIVL